MTAAMSRRQLLVRGTGLAVGLGLGGSVLSACGSSSASSTKADTSPGPASFGALTVALGWIKDVSAAGELLADERGYYKAAGFSGVTLRAGGPSAAPSEAQVGSGKALVGLSSPDITAAAIAQGARVTTVGSQFQKSPYCLMSMAGKPITSPKDLVGKRIGVQSNNELVWKTFLGLNKIDPSAVKKVTVQYDPLPLTTGEVDGWISYEYDEPNTLREKGFKVTVMPFSDYGWHLLAQSYVVSTAALKDQREALKAFFVAELKGWRDDIRNPADGVDVTMSKAGPSLGLDRKHQVLENASQLELFQTSETKANGLFTVSADLQSQVISTLSASGVKADATTLFDSSLLQEVYQEHPELKAAL